MTAPLIEHDVLQATLDHALSRGGDFAEVFVEDRRSSSGRFDDGRIEELVSGRDRGAGLRVVRGDTTGFAHTADLSPRRTAASGRGGGRRGPRRRRRDAHGRARGRPRPIRSTPTSCCRRRSRSAARSSCWPAPMPRPATAGSAVTSVTASYADARRRILVANSDGLLADDDRVRTRMSVQCVATGDTGMQTGYEAPGPHDGLRALRHVRARGRRPQGGRQRARRCSKRCPAPSGRLPVVLKRGAGGVLFHEACGHGLEADHILKDASVFKGQMGDAVASPLVTLVDDGGYAHEWGTLAIDDEGHAAQRNVLIENGVLTDYMWDVVRARKEGRAPSGNGRRESYRHLPMPRMTNTFLLEGETDPDDIIRSVDFGIYCGAARRRSGRSRDRRLRVRHHRGVPHREGRDHPARSAPRS